jgi:hypothetical protein
MQYRVHWVVDIEADTPEEAAKLAQEMQHDPESTATFFSVEDEDGEVVDIEL